MKTFKQYSAKAGDNYFRTMSDAFRKVEAELAPYGVSFDEDDYFQKVATGPRKPSKGQTNSYNILLKGTKGSREKYAHIQIYGMDSGKYELNWYSD